MKLKELRLKNGLLQDQVAEVLQIKKNRFLKSTLFKD